MGEREVMGLVFNIQRYSVQDGPGIRTTVFLKGCPLRCAWCSNPESQMTDVELAHIDRFCTRCGRCAEVCQMRAISVTDSGVRVDRLKCNGCGKCVEFCYEGALRVFSTRVSAEEVLREVKRDELFYRNSGGGVTISGGEPLLQFDFVRELLERCHGIGLHTALDTSGYVWPAKIDEIFPHLDLILYDIKHMDTNLHEKLTAVPVEAILQNCSLFAASKIPMILRIPLIPDFNDSEENIKKTADFALSLNGIEELDLLPYHRWGAAKYQMLDRSYELGELRTPTAIKIERLKGIIESFGLRCEVGG